MKETIDLLAKLKSLPFPPQILGLMNGMAIANETLWSMSAAWGHMGIQNGVPVDSVNKTARAMLKHLSEMQMLTLRYALNDLEVPDALRSMYMGYLLQCCTGCTEAELANSFEKNGIPNDLLSDQRLPRVDVPDKQNIVLPN